MKKSIIAVDVDEVLAANAPSFITYSNRQWNLNLTIDDYHEHWAELWGVDHEETLRRASQYNASESIAEMAHIAEAEGVLRSLAERYELVITTARRQEVSQVTRQWIDAYFSGIFRDIHHVNIWDTEQPDAHTYTKAEVCKQIGASYLIDDQSKHCNAAQLAGVQAILYGNYPWNRSDEIVEGVVRCANWYEILDYFDGISAG